MIAVIGLGFVGLTTALGFSNKKNKVYGFDVNEEKAGLIRTAKVPFYEPFLEDALKRDINKRFFIADNLKDAVVNSKIIFYAVGTPCDQKGHADLKYLLCAIKETLKHVKKGEYKILVVKSTIPPSTTKEIICPFVENLGFKVGRDIGLANNPEFLREGNAWLDFTKPDRVVIGAEDDKSWKLLEKIYKPYNAPIFRVSLNSAEFIKYLSNTLLSTLISYSNEMSIIADKVGDIDVKKSFKIIHMDKRWSGNPASMTSYVYPGCGFGGYCLPKDTQALHALSTARGYEPTMIRGTLHINERIKEHVSSKVEQCAPKNETIGILGLAFKSNSDDVRQTPAAEIIKALLAKGYKNIIAYDPIATGNFKREYNLPIQYAGTMTEIIKKADHLLILTAWDEFKKDKRILKKHILDFRYML